MAVKQKDWQKVYQPRQDALDMRVRQTLRTLDTETDGRAWNMKRAMALALAAVLLLAAAAALAAGLIFSDKVDAQAAARQALAEQYGFTAAMEAFFDCEVATDGSTVIYTPSAYTGAALEDKLGTYTVTLARGSRAAASWSHDGEQVGEDLQSPVWDTRLLGMALARKAAGEEWIDIRLGEDQTAVNVAPEEAADIARHAVAERFGEDTRIDAALGVHLYIRSIEDAEADGLGAKCYQISLVGTGKAYEVRLYANSGEVFECEEMQDEPDDVRKVTPAIQQSHAEDERAKALAAITPEQAAQLAMDAASALYGLSPAQRDSMEWVEDVYPSPYAMKGETPVVQVWLWLWMGGDGAAYAEGDGVYQVEVNAQDGTIESILYDSALSGNG